MTDEQKKYVEHIAAETLKKVYLARAAYITELVFAGQYGAVSIPAPSRAEFDVLCDLITSFMPQSELSLAVPETVKKKGKK